MYKKLVSFIIVLLCATVANANISTQKTKKITWPFEGFFGSVDRQAAQRGAQVYLEVCASCHGVYHLYYRNLKNIGFSEAEIKQIAQEYTVIDGPNDDGDMFERPALPRDKFVKPYANEQAARASNNGAYPPDLSLIVKARADGANYLYSLLTGYKETPSGFNIMEGLYYNDYFEGQQIAMPPPLIEGQVAYIDGTEATIEQMSRDVTVFLQWAAEPEMEHRKSMGIKVSIYLVLFTLFFYIAKKKIWANIDKKK